MPGVSRLSRRHGERTSSASGQMFPVGGGIQGRLNVIAPPGQLDFKTGQISLSQAGLLS